MPVVSIRFTDEPLHRRLKASAHRHDIGVSTLAERLIDEGLRMEAHPMVVFRDGPRDGDPVLAGGPEVADVIGTIVGGDVPAGGRRTRAAKLLGIPEPMVDAALAYYADFTDEIDVVIAERTRIADEAGAAWRRQRELLERVKLLLDEMHAPGIAESLVDESFDVVAVAAQPALRGMPDEDLLIYATAHQRALVTENVADFMPLVMQWAGANKAHPGLIFTNPNRFNRATLAYPGNLIDGLRRLLIDPPVSGDSWIWWL